MKNPKIEFQIVNDVKRDAERIFVEGRCIEGPIFCAQKINTVAKISPTITPEDATKFTRTFLASVDLEVKSIFAYGKFIDEMSEGLTGRLELVGSGIESIEKGVAISFAE